MDLEHSFTVPVGVDDAWTILLDVERVAPCMPGASLETVDGDEFTGNVKVKLGAINLTYKGKASFVEKDEAAHRAVIDARGRDSRGNGTAAAKVTTLLTDEGGSTKVLVKTELDITGKVAQFGRGVMVDVGNKLIGQFAECLAQTISAGNEPPATESDGAATAKTAPARKTASKSAKKATPAKTATPAAKSAPASKSASKSAPAEKSAAAEKSAPAAKRARPRPTKPTDEAASTEPASSSETSPTNDAVDPTAQTLETPTIPETPAPDDAALQTVSETPGYSAPAAPPDEPTVEAPVSPVNGRTAAAAEREVEPIDLLEHAGPAIAKRAAPPAALLLLILLYVILRRVQRD